MFNQIDKKKLNVIYLLFCNESIGVNDIKNVYNMSLLFIRTLKVNSIGYYI